MRPQDRFNAAVKLRQANRLDDCQDECERLWKSGFQNEFIALLRGNLQLDLGNYHDSLNWYGTAWSMIAPDNHVKPEAASYFPEIALPFAYARMRAGLWDSHTWALFEVGRLGRSWSPAPGTRPWDGSPEKMIVLSEGGYGDAFLFSRFFQKLDPMQRAASRFVMGPQFAGLNGFRQDWDGMTTVSHDEQIDWRSFRFSTALMSLMAVMQIRGPEDIPAASLAGISGEPNWERPTTRIPRAKKFVSGLCWRAEELGVQKRIRSIDNSEDLEPLDQWDFINLCPGHSIDQHEGFGCPTLVDLPLTSWNDTARAIAAMDVVVTVDSAVAHLAGLLGVRTLLIVPLCVDYKWGVSGESTYWWPSVTVIRNDSPYSFKGAVTSVAELLGKL